MRAHSYPEACWQQLRHRHRQRFSIAQEPNRRLRRGKLRDHLPTRPTRRELLAEGNDGKRCNPHPRSLLGHSMKNRAALRTNRQPITRVLHIAAAEDVPRCRQQRTTDLKLRIRRIGFHRRGSGLFEEGLRMGHARIKALEQRERRGARASAPPPSNLPSRVVHALYPPSGARPGCRNRACHSLV